MAVLKRISHDKDRELLRFRTSLFIGQLPVNSCAITGTLPVLSPSLTRFMISQTSGLMVPRGRNASFLVV
jgi:hypothetical protein